MDVISELLVKNNGATAKKSKSTEHRVDPLISGNMHSNMSNYTGPLQKLRKAQNTV